MQPDSNLLRFLFTASVKLLRAAEAAGHNRLIQLCDFLSARHDSAAEKVRHAMQNRTTTDGIENDGNTQ